ncbi:MAG: DUF1109 family protein [Alphaproteobacteria bacterium]|nr:DUF1109 family protein [Alphaproteobacteria bacterium]
MTSDDIDKTINTLCTGLKPVKPCCPTRNSLLWILLVICYTSAVAFTIGFRENIIESMGRANYLFEIILAFSIAMTASLMTFWLSIPDCEKQKKFIAVPLTLLAVQCVWILERLFFEGLGSIRENWLSHCWMNTALHTTIPALAVILLVKKSGASVMPCWMAAFALISVSEFGWIGMRLVCPKDNVGEAYLLNFLPYVMIGVVLGFVAKKLFRW